jgi:hypothetical protein
MPVIVHICFVADGICTAVQALNLHHREAQKGVMNFCEKMVGLPALLAINSAQPAQMERAKTIVLR